MERSAEASERLARLGDALDDLVDHYGDAMPEHVRKRVTTIAGDVTAACDLFCLWATNNAAATNGGAA